MRCGRRHTPIPGLLADPERDLRSALRLPPFGALAVVTGPGAAKMAEEVADGDGLEVSAAGSDRWLLRAADHDVLCDALARARRPAERVRVEVDPVDV